MQVKPVLIAACFFGFSSVAFAQNATTEVGQDQAEVQEFNVNELRVDDGFLKSWGITKEEYARFIYLKRNTPRGVITPQANPLYYLGLEARTPAERERFAQKVAQMEFENAQKGSEWRAAVQAAAVKLYGQGDLVDLKKGMDLEQMLEKTAASLKGGRRGSVVGYGGAGVNRQIYVSSDCDDCLPVYKKALRDLTSGSLTRLEIVFPAGTPDLQIRQWATKAGVPIELNKRGVVELRHQDDKEERVSKFPTVVDSDM